MQWIWALHVFCCFFMTGLIWVVQSVHYPAYRYIDPHKFTTYQRFHTRVISCIVGPVMTVELFSGLYLFLHPRAGFNGGLNLAGLLVIWLATVALSIPAHDKLALGSHEGHIGALIRGNWIRTLVWSGRSVLICVSLAEVAH